jgi:hypothetical protein
MSLFDVIRYPISDLPTISELAALPEEVYNMLRRHDNYVSVLNTSSTSSIKYFLTTQYASKHMPIHQLNTLTTLREVIYNL